MIFNCNFKLKFYYYHPGSIIYRVVAVGKKNVISWQCMIVLRRKCAFLICDMYRKSQSYCYVKD